MIPLIKKEFSPEHFERRKERKKLARKLKWKRFFSFKKKKIVELSDEERVKFLQKQARYCVDYRIQLEEKFNFYKTNNCELSIPFLLYRTRLEEQKKRTEELLKQKNIMELYIAEIIRQDEKVVSELKKKHEKMCDKKNSEEFQKRISEFETVKIKKLSEKKKNALIGLEEFNVDSDIIENQIQVKKKGYRKSKKLLLESEQQLHTEIDQLFMTIQNSKNMTAAEQQKNFKEIERLEAKIAEIEKNKVNILASFNDNADYGVYKSNDVSFDVSQADERINELANKSKENQQNNGLMKKDLTEKAKQRRVKNIKERQFENNRKSLKENISDISEKKDKEKEEAN